MKSVAEHIGKPVPRFRRGMRAAFAVATVSDRGLVRAENQDSVLADPVAGLFAVADGMGGGAEGATASRMVCDLLASSVRAVDGFAAAMNATDLALAEANGRILAYAASRGYRQMGSTAVVLLVRPDEPARGAVCHVGDSRIYRIRGETAQLLTRDHTVANALGGAAGREGVAGRADPLAHVLTRVIGCERCVEPEWRRVDLRPGDRFLLCSDGVHDVVEPVEISFVFAGSSPESACRRLAALVRSRGAPDNFSCVAVEVGADGGDNRKDMT